MWSIAYSGRSCLDLGSPPPLCEHRDLDISMEDSFFEVVLDVVTTPLRGGGPTVSPWEIVVTLYSV